MARVADSDEIQFEAEESDVCSETLELDLVSIEAVLLSGALIILEFCPTKDFYT